MHVTNARRPPWPKPPPKPPGPFPHPGYPPWRMTILHGVLIQTCLKDSFTFCHAMWRHATMADGMWQTLLLLTVLDASNVGVSMHTLHDCITHEVCMNVRLAGSLFRGSVEAHGYHARFITDCGSSSETLDAPLRLEPTHLGRAIASPADRRGPLPSVRSLVDSTLIERAFNRPRPTHVAPVLQAPLGSSIGCRMRRPYPSVRLCGGSMGACSHIRSILSFCPLLTLILILALIPIYIPSHQFPRCLFSRLSRPSVPQEVPRRKKRGIGMEKDFLTGC